MKKPNSLLLAIFILAASSSAWSSDAVNQLLQEYKKQGATSFNKQTGAELWTRKFTQAGQDARSCAACHTTDPSKAGKHLRTGKTIEPLAPSVNPRRLTDIRKINKWLLRNCKWTLGRECSAQEKGDVLTYLNSL